MVILQFILVLLYLLFAHWVGDFLFQTTEMGTKKSEDITILMRHVATYTLVLMAMTSLILNVVHTFELGIISFLCHGTQDFITSRLTKRQFSKQIYNGWNGGFTIIGIDQFLHFTQLFLTYYFLVYYPN